MSDQPTTKMRYEELFDKFREAAEGWLKETPEARSLVLTVDWALGQNDFPASTFVFKGPLNERIIVESTKQALKTIDNLSALFKQYIQTTESLLTKAEAIVKSQQTS